MTRSPLTLLGAALLLAGCGSNGVKPVRAAGASSASASSASASSGASGSSASTTASSQGASSSGTTASSGATSSAGATGSGATSAGATGTTGSTSTSTGSTVSTSASGSVTGSTSSSGTADSTTGSSTGSGSTAGSSTGSTGSTGASTAASTTGSTSASSTGTGSTSGASSAASTGSSGATTSSTGSTSSATSSSSSSGTTGSTGTSSSSSSSSSGTTTGGTTTGGTTTGTTGTTGGTTASPGHLRLALLVPDLPVSVDFCLHAHSASGNSFEIGPLAHSLGLNGFSYPNVTRYLDLAADTYDVRTVAAGSTRCNNKLFGTTDRTSAFAVVGGAYHTFVVFGTAFDNAHPTDALVLDDQFTVSDPTLSALRFVHTAVGVSNAANEAVDLVHPGNTPTVLFSGVDYGSLALGTSGDYLEDSSGSATFRVRNAASQATIVTSSAQTLVADKPYLVLSVGQSGSATHPAQVLVCLDEPTAATTGNALSTCTLSP